MLTAAGCQARRRRLWDALASPCDALIVAQPQHLIYFANYAQSPFEFRSNDAGALLILEPDHAALAADNIVGPYLERSHADEVVAPNWYEGKRSAPIREDVRVGAALGILARKPVRRVGIEPASVPAAMVEGLKSRNRGLEFVDLGP